jgi:hypothetical protein
MDNQEGELKQCLEKMMLLSNCGQTEPTYQIVRMKQIIDEIAKDFPSCETCIFDIDLPDHRNPPSNCYIKRHQYPSKCPKDEWFLKNMEGIRRWRRRSKT